MDRQGTEVPERQEGTQAATHRAGLREAPVGSPYGTVEFKIPDNNRTQYDTRRCNTARHDTTRPTHPTQHAVYLVPRQVVRGSPLGPHEDQPTVSLLELLLRPHRPQSSHDPLHGFSADAAALHLFHHMKEVKSGCVSGESMEWAIRGLRSVRAKQELKQRHGGLAFVGPRWEATTARLNQIPDSKTRHDKTRHDTDHSPHAAGGPPRSPSCTGGLPTGAPRRPDRAAAAPSWPSQTLTPSLPIPSTPRLCSRF